jgi:hypothetical protein
MSDPASTADIHLSGCCYVSEVPKGDIANQLDDFRFTTVSG